MGTKLWNRINPTAMLVGKLYEFQSLWSVPVHPIKYGNGMPSVGELEPLDRFMVLEGPLKVESPTSINSWFRIIGTEKSFLGWVTLSDKADWVQEIKGE